jgi:membrane-bound serine protease (ClpP class)
MKHFLLYISLFFPWLLPAQEVISIKIDGTINPVAAEYIHRTLEKAAGEQAACVLIHLNTPGGLLKSTRDIVGNLLESKTPVIVYVSPAGAHAGSAGVFITLAADIAAMAPGTNIGAAHPVDMKGEVDTIMNTKATNDAAAFIRTIAEFRKRNLMWAEEAVRQSVAITQKEALEQHIIDLVASSDGELLEAVDGRTITRGRDSLVLHTRGAGVQVLEMDFSEKLLNLISDPDIAYMLMMLGFFGILLEFFNPGSIFPGIVGFICLVLAFYALNTLPLNYAGLALIVFALVLFLLEIKVASHGMLAIGGIVSLLTGSLMLVKPGSGLEFARISRTVIVSFVILTAGFFLFIIGMGLKAQRLKPVTGLQGMLGETGETLDDLNPAGSARVHGETWKAVSAGGHINRGEKVRVVEVRDLTLIVEPIHT